MVPIIADAVVVGGGVNGARSAYALAARGARRAGAPGVVV